MKTGSWSDLNRAALGKAVKAQRKRYGESIGRRFTQDDLCRKLADELGAPMNKRTLSRIETGEQEPTASQLVQISIALGGPYWRATMCEMVEDSLGSYITDVTGVSDESLYRMRDEKAADTIEKFMETEKLVRDSMEELMAVVVDLINSEMSIEGALLKPDPRLIYDPMKDPSNYELEQLFQQATPAPTPGAVAIDEPEGKEHEHEQD